MKKYIKYLLLALIVFSMLACSKKSDETSQINLRFDWIPTMSFAGDVVAMNNYADKNKLHLTLHPAGEGIDPIKMVISGVDDIGIIGLDKLLMANEKGADLVAIGIVDNVTPTVFMSKKEKNILSPYDFIGKKVGVQSGGATEFVYRALISKLNIDESKINEVQIGFDMKPFVEGQYDVRPGFIFDEAVYLDINNIPYNLIEPKNYGLKYPGRVYFVKKDYLQKNRHKLQFFIDAVAEGWKYALAHPDSAINQLQKFEPKIDYKREYTGLTKAKDYFSGFDNEILMPDTTSIRDMVVTLQKLNILHKSPALNEYFDLSFVKKLHHKQ